MSTETKWTPGPWHSRGFPTISAGKGNGMIAKVFERYMDRAEREANANLIAAAPELYEALADARELTQALINDGYTGYIGQRGRIDAALAKARGEHS